MRRLPQQKIHSRPMTRYWESLRHTLEMQNCIYPHRVKSEWTYAILYNQLPIKQIHPCQSKRSSVTFSDNQKIGVPQVLVMNTILFLIKINDIIINLKPPAKTQLFANDITITCSGKNVHYINEHLEIVVNTTQDWSKTSTVFSQK